MFENELGCGADGARERINEIRERSMIDASDKRLAGLRLSVRERLARPINHAQTTGTLNRSDICSIGEVSVPQASTDIRVIIERFPNLLKYDASAKTYRARKLRAA